jgi:hypothetical protein
MSNMVIMFPNERTHVVTRVPDFQHPIGEFDVLTPSSGYKVRRIKNCIDLEKQN